MSIAALWSRFPTDQAAIFHAARRDTAIFTPGCVGPRSRTTSPRYSGRRAGNENPSRRDHGLIVNAP